MRLHFQRMAIGACVGMLIGALYPLQIPGGSFNAVPVLTFEYTLVGAMMGFVVSNYLGFRQRLKRRIEESRQAKRS